MLDFESEVGKCLTISTYKQPRVSLSVYHLNLEYLYMYRLSLEQWNPPCNDKTCDEKISYTKFLYEDSFNFHHLFIYLFIDEEDNDEYDENNDHPTMLYQL